MTFSGFPKVKWLQYADKMGKCRLQVIDVKFSQDLTHEQC